jgi:hypothetical protein
MTKFIKIAVVAIITSLLTTPLVAQITITTADLPTPFLWWSTAIDTAYQNPMLPGGSSAVWDYSNIQTNELDTIGFIPSSGTPYQANFPTANLYGFDVQTNTHTYFSTNANGLYFNGGVLNSTILAYNPPYIFMPTPFTFNNLRNETARFQIDTVYFDPVLGNINARIIRNVNITILCDGYGQLILPVATYQNTLRIRFTELTSDSILADLLGLGIYTTISATQSQITNFRFVKNGVNAYLLGITADSLGQNTITAEYQTNYLALNTNEQLLSDPTIYPNPFKDVIRFSNDITFDRISIYNQLGCEILTLENPSAPVSTIDLAPGIYLFKGYKNGIPIVKRKIIKQ